MIEFERRSLDLLSNLHFKEIHLVYVEKKKRERLDMRGLRRKLLQGISQEVIKICSRIIGGK